MLGKRRVCTVQPRAACSLLPAVCCLPPGAEDPQTPARLSLTGSEDSAAAALHSHASQYREDRADESCSKCCKSLADNPS